MPQFYVVVSKKPAGFLCLPDVFVSHQFLGHCPGDPGGPAGGLQSVPLGLAKTIIDLPIAFLELVLGLSLLIFSAVRPWRLSSTPSDWILSSPNKALVVQPKLLLMDEPFSAKDPTTKKEIRSMMHTVIQTQDTTIVPEGQLYTIHLRSNGLNLEVKSTLNSLTQLAPKSGENLFACIDPEHLRIVGPAPTEHSL